MVRIDTYESTLIDLTTEFQHGEDFVNNCLEHYGVLGMKWGVRRYQPYPAGKHGTFLGQDIRDQDIRIKAGTKIYRVQAGKDIPKDVRSLYASCSKADHMEYVYSAIKGQGVAMNAVWKDGDTNQPHSLRMIVNKDLIAPSYNKTMEAFIHTMNQVKIQDVMVASGDKKDLKERMKRSRVFKEDAEKLIKGYKDKKHQEALDDAYWVFSSKMMRDTKARKIFMDYLEKQGYNSIVDDHDVYFGRPGYSHTDSALIIFGGHDSVKLDKAKAISINDAQYIFDKVYGQMSQLDKGIESKANSDWTKHMQLSKSDADTLLTEVRKKYNPAGQQRLEQQEKWKTLVGGARQKLKDKGYNEEEIDRLLKKFEDTYVRS